MFSSTSSSSFDPLQFVNRTMTSSCFTDGQNPSSIQEALTSPFMHFPAPPFLDDDYLLLSEFLSQQQQQPQILGLNSTLADGIQEIIPATSSKAATGIKNKKKRSHGNEAKKPVPRKRTGKKDRHSKIYTAQGPRDRRMRLSLQIARKFFDLQDMLGFDKASKTIEWLFTKSMVAIKELTDSLPRMKKSSSAGRKSVSSTSDSEVVSGIQLTTDEERKRGMVAESESLMSIPRGKKSEQSHKVAFNPFAKASREKARARARERTREKMKIKSLDKAKQSSQANPNNLEKLGPNCNPLQNGENLCSGSQEMNSPVQLVDEEEGHTTHLLQNQMDSVSIYDKSLGITRAIRSSSIFDFSHNFAVPNGANFEDEFTGFHENWDMTNGRVQYRHRAVPNTKLSTGSVHLQNPNANFMTNPNVQELKTSSNFITTSNVPQRNLTSIFMATFSTQEQNRGSVFMNMSNSNEQNPSSILMTTTEPGFHSRLIDNQFSCSPIFANHYGSFN